MASAARQSMYLVMASAARPSIVEVRGDGLPRCARNDEGGVRMYCRAALAMTDVVKSPSHQLKNWNKPMSEWKKICLVTDIPVLGSRRVARAKGVDVAVFRNDQDGVFALLDRCPHKGGPLSQGIVFGTSVACPLHNWTIGLADGCARAPDEGCTPKFSVKVTDGSVFLDNEELASHAIDLLAPVAGPGQKTAITSEA